ncbi:Mur ligase family protein [Anaeroselena agilis]|uniref:Mur ligase family protein n=1 Tax=Anaeroselena agilis TaxID=3063788 RepID=A0ABU3P190_9FIRM|nr:Mur ligase family protein [Selenomonadales bacterium 4137-cl]
MELFDRILASAAGITCDSRQVAPGFIFVAVRGSSRDGNTYAADAAARGAVAIVSDRPASLPALAAPVVAVPDARRALGELAARFHRHPSRSLSLIGVTGTNGKTTVTFMLDHIFRHAGLRSGLIGTVCVRAGDRVHPSALTTPDAASLQTYLAAMRDTGVSHAAMEVSAQGIDQGRVDDVTFACGVITNISPDHLDFPGGFDAYCAAKQGFPGLLGPAAPLVVNAADPLCRVLAAAHDPVVACAVDAPADVAARVTGLAGGGSRFVLAFTRPLPGCGPAPGELAVTLPLPGRHNIENALMAATAAALCGIAPATAAAALASFRGVPRRFAVSRLAGLTVVDDTALNPASIDAVFHTLAAFSRRRLVVAFAIRGRRGPAINTACADALARWWRAAPFTLIVTAAAGSVSAADTVAGDEKSAFCEALGKAKVGYIFRETLAAAMEAAADAAGPGDLVTLLGAQGMDDGYRLLRRLLTGTTTAQPGTAAAGCPA